MTWLLTESAFDVDTANSTFWSDWASSRTKYLNYRMARMGQRTPKTFKFVNGSVQYTDYYIVSHFQVWIDLCLKDVQKQRIAIDALLRQWASETMKHFTIKKTNIGNTIAITETLEAAPPNLTTKQLHAMSADYWADFKLNDARKMRERDASARIVAARQTEGLKAERDKQTAMHNDTRTAQRHVAESTRRARMTANDIERRTFRLTGSVERKPAPLSYSLAPVQPRRDFSRRRMTETPPASVLTLRGKTRRDGL